MLTTNGLSHRKMAYMCSKCVWFHFVWKELWVCFYLRKEHGMHMHSFLKWETLIEFNRSFVWAGNSELSSMGDEFGFSGQDFRVYLPNFLGLFMKQKAGGTSACVTLVPLVWPWADRRSLLTSHFSTPSFQSGSIPYTTVDYSGSVLCVCLSVCSCT